MNEIFLYEETCKEMMLTLNKIRKMYSLEMHVFSKYIICDNLPLGIFHSVPMQNIAAKLITLHKIQKEGC
jgi:hypothetical protein